MAAETGDFLLNLLFPRHVLDYVYLKDKTIYAGNLVREISGYKGKSHESGDPWLQRLFFITAGSRANSLRTPYISLFDESGKKLRMQGSDFDIMVMHPEVFVGDTSGPIHLEFIRNPANVPYGKIEAVSGFQYLPKVLVPGIDHNGRKATFMSGQEVHNCMGKLYRNPLDSELWKRWKRKGPAYEGKNVGKGKYHYDKKIDIVMALLSSKNYFKEEIADVMAHSHWSSEVKKAVLSTPVSFVQVAPKMSKELDIQTTWRASFSMHEVIIGRSLNFHQRQIYMAIRYIVTCSLDKRVIPQDIDNKQFSTYLVMNAYFTLSDANPTRDWSVKMLQSVYQYFEHFVRCLSECVLPQYLCPQNNLLSDVTGNWVEFYSNMFTFNNESDLVGFLLENQRSHRVVQFEICLHAYWSGAELTTQDAKDLLLKISVEAIIKLDTVRAVQALWNHFEMYQTLSSVENNSDSPPYKKTHGLEFWNEVFVEIKSMVSEQRLSQSKHIQLMAVLQHMVPKENNDDVVNFIQENLDAEGIDTMQCESEPHYSVKYEHIVNVDDCTIEYQNEKVLLKLINDNDATYEFPHTDNFLLFSKEFMHFMTCQQALKKTPYDHIQKQLELFHKNFPERPRDDPLVKLLDIMRQVFCPEEFTFPDFNDYMVA